MDGTPSSVKSEMDNVSMATAAIIPPAAFTFSNEGAAREFTPPAFQGLGHGESSRGFSTASGSTGGFKAPVANNRKGKGPHASFKSDSTEKTYQGGKGGFKKSEPESERVDPKTEENKPSVNKKPWLDHRVQKTPRPTLPENYDPSILSQRVRACKTFAKWYKASVPDNDEVWKGLVDWRLEATPYADVHPNFGINPHACSAVAREYATIYAVVELIGLGCTRIVGVYGSEREKRTVDRLLAFIQAGDHVQFCLTGRCVEPADLTRRSMFDTDMVPPEADGFLMVNVYLFPNGPVTPASLAPLVSMGPVMMVHHVFQGRYGILDKAVWYRDKEDNIVFHPDTINAPYTHPSNDWVLVDGVHENVVWTRHNSWPWKDRIGVAVTYVTMNHLCAPSYDPRKVMDVGKGPFLLKDSEGGKKLVMGKHLSLDTTRDFNSATLSHIEITVKRGLAVDPDMRRLEQVSSQAFLEYAEDCVAVSVEHYKKQTSTVIKDRLENSRTQAWQAQALAKQHGVLPTGPMGTLARNVWDVKQQAMHLRDLVREWGITQFVLAFLCVLMVSILYLQICAYGAYIPDLTGNALATVNKTLGVSSFWRGLNYLLLGKPTNQTAVVVHRVVNETAFWRGVRLVMKSPTNFLKGLTIFSAPPEISSMSILVSFWIGSLLAALIEEILRSLDSVWGLPVITIIFCALEMTKGPGGILPVFTVHLLCIVFRLRFASRLVWHCLWNTIICMLLFVSLVTKAISVEQLIVGYQANFGNYSNYTATTVLAQWILDCLTEFTAFPSVNCIGEDWFIPAINIALSDTIVDQNLVTYLDKKISMFLSNESRLSKTTGYYLCWAHCQPMFQFANSLANAWFLIQERLCKTPPPLEGQDDLIYEAMKLSTVIVDEERNNLVVCQKINQTAGEIKELWWKHIREQGEKVAMHTQYLLSHPTLQNQACNIDKISLGTTRVNVKSDEVLFKCKPRPIHAIEGDMSHLLGPYIYHASKVFAEFCRQGLWRAFLCYVAVDGASVCSSVPIFYASSFSADDLTFLMTYFFSMSGLSGVILIAGDDVLFVYRTAQGYCMMEADFSQCDNSVRAPALHAEMIVLNALGVPAWILDLLWALYGRVWKVGPRSVKRVFYVKHEEKRLTGGPDTTLGNSFVCGSVIKRAIEVALALFGLDKDFGDNLKIACAQLGFEVKVKCTFWNEEQIAFCDALPVTFLKGTWYHAGAQTGVMHQGEFKWGPLPSRMLKISKTFSNPCVIYRDRGERSISLMEGQRRHMVAVAKSLIVFDLPYPMRTWFDQLINESTWGPVTELKVIHTKKVKNSSDLMGHVVPQYTAGEWECPGFFEERYGVCSSDYYRWTGEVIALRARSVACDPVWKSLLVDYL